MSEADWKSFCEENPPTDDLLETRARIASFVDFHVSLGNDLVLITSGGTSVPLEHSTVRFVDNFSLGTRGAASAEYFLKAGLAVIFMYRSKSLEPFLRHVPVQEILESSTLEPPNAGDGIQSVKIQGKICDQLVPVINDYKNIKSKNMLLKLEFTTLPSYLHLLYVASNALKSMGQNAILYCAAAVSDFYIPEKEMSVHKISSEEPLNLTLKVVPKMLQPLVKHWMPNSFVVSFKLETNPDILIDRAKASLQKYGHKLVIANELHNRKQKVVFVTKSDIKPILLADTDFKAGKEIEEIIVKELLRIHADFKCR